MSFYSNIHELSHHIGLCSSIDYIELFVTIYLVYRISLWLASDTQKPLLMYAYSYWGAIVGSYIVGLYTIHLTLLLCIPLTLILFIIFHEHRLQKNFISLSRIHSAKKPLNTQWVETIIQCALQQMHQNQEIIYIIQRSDPLDTFLNIPYRIDTPVQLELMQTIYTSGKFKHQQYVLIDQQGKLIAINTQLSKTAIDQTIIKNSCKQYSRQIQEAIILSKHTDALICIGQCSSLTFSIISEQTMVELVRPTQALSMLQNLLNSVTKAKGAYDAKSPEKTETYTH